LIYKYKIKIFQFFIQKKIEEKYLYKIKGIIEMSDSPVTNENMIPQGPPIVNLYNTSAHANNVIEYHAHTPPTSPPQNRPPRLERRNNSRAPVLMRTDSVRPLMLEQTDTLCPPPLERNEPVCHERMLDPSDFGYDSMLDLGARDPNFHAMFDPSQFMYDGYGPVLERSDSIRHTGAYQDDSIQPSILTRSGFIPPPPLIRNDSRPSFDNDNEDGPPPLIRLGSDIFPVVYDFTSDDEYDIVQRDTFEWFPPSSSTPPK
jgi:hypothetical protein